MRLGADIVSRQQIDEAYAGMITAKAALAIADNAAKKSIVRSNMTGIVLTAPEGRPLLLRDLGRVVDGFEEATAPFALVLTDLTMPERSGLDLIEELARRWPALPVVVITGLAGTPELEQVKEMGAPFLRKPFDPDQLVARIRETLLR